MPMYDSQCQFSNQEAVVLFQANITKNTYGIGYSGNVFGKAIVTEPCVSRTPTVNLISRRLSNKCPIPHFCL